MIKLYWEKWKRLAEKMGDIQFTILFSIIYYILIVPVGFIVKGFHDFIDQKSFPRWEEFENNLDSIKSLKEQ